VQAILSAVRFTQHLEIAVASSLLFVLKEFLWKIVLVSAGVA
jgi:hypothetical protein